MLKNLDTRKISLYDLDHDLGERQDLSRTMPEKADALHRTLTRYLDDVDAENVQHLRANFRKRVVEEWIPNWEEKVVTLRAAVEEGDHSRKAELEKAERHVAWLKQQVVFTDERSKLHP